MSSYHCRFDDKDRTAASGFYDVADRLLTNDHGDKITGVLTKRQKTVAMVAFSPDDKKLMSVSDDGVIVIRNLHL